MNEADKISKALTEVAEGESNVINIIQKMIGTDDNNKKVAVEVTRTKVMPVRMESPPRIHTFHDAAGFIDFVKANKTKHTIVMADVDNVSIFAILDDRANSGFETVKLEPPYHPKFTLLNETLLDQSLEISEFARQIMRNRSVIRDTDKATAKDLALTMQQITIASSTVQAIGDGKASVNGLMCTTKIVAGSPDAKEPVQIPDSFNVKLPIYLNTDDKEFEIDITISTKNHMVMATIDAPEVDLKKYEVFEEMLEPIKEMKEILVTYGNPNHGAWAYNR